MISRSSIALRLAEGELGLFQRTSLSGHVLRGGAELFLHDLARPGLGGAGPQRGGLALDDVLADELDVLRVDAVAILAESDVVDLVDRVGLVDDRLGLGPLDPLGLELVLEGGAVELADDLGRP